MDSKVHVVTGGAGFIGSHLVQALLRAGRRVRVVDDFSSGRRANLDEDTEFVEADVTSAAGRVLEDAEVVYHLAAMVSVPRSVERPLASHRSTAESTLAVLAAAERAGARRVVFASSSAVYGNAPALPKKESQSPEPISPYAVAKLCGELYARYWALQGRLETVSLRFFNVFGPRQDPDSPYAAAIPLFLRQLREEAPVTIYGDGRQTRDFTFVGDVVEALVAAGKAPEASGGVYNIAAGRPVSVLDLVETIGHVTGVPVQLDFLPSRSGDVRDSWADISAASRDLGYSPRTSLEEGLRITADWMERARRISSWR